jgi:hypothetical protein
MPCCTEAQILSDPTSTRTSHHHLSWEGLTKQFNEATYGYTLYLNLTASPECGPSAAFYTGLNKEKVARL